MQDADSPVFLGDEPANSSGNAYALHQRIADVLAENITSEKTPKENRKVAIIGDWGSGKSTVIRILQENLQEERCHRKICMVVFDLWAHTGDALRRSFLQELNHNLKEATKDLCGETEDKWKEWDDKLKYEELSVTEKTENDYSPLALFLIFLVPLYAFFGAIGAALSGTVAADFLGSFGQLIYIALAVIADFLIAYIASGGRKGKPILLSFKDGIKLVASHLAGDSIDETTHTTTQTQLMGSIMFSDYLNQMMTSLEELQDQKILSDFEIVIVLDNLDRLSHVHQRDAWDDIQIFADYMDTGQPFAESMWLILPVADETIDALMREDIDDEESNTPQWNRQALSKLFIAQYRIPKSIVTEWKESVRALLQKAFPDITEQQQQTIISVLNISPSSESLKNQREQKRIVNEMVALKQLHPGVCFDSIVTYLYLRDKYESETRQTEESTFENWVTQQIATRSKDTPLLSGIPVKFIPAEIAMLTFGVFDKNQAQEVLLRGIVSSSDLLHDADLNVYVEQVSGFWEVLQKYLREHFVLSKTAVEAGQFDDKDNEIFIELLEQITKTKCATPSQKESRRSLLETASEALSYSQWANCSGAGQALLSMLEELEPQEGALYKALFTLRNPGTRFADLSQREAETWIKEAATFLNGLVERSVEVKEQSFEVDAGENLGCLLEVVASFPYKTDIVSSFLLRSVEALKKLAGLLVSDDFDVSPDLIKVLASSDLLCVPLEEFQYGELSAYGLNMQQRFALFVQMWAIYRQQEGAQCAFRYLRETVRRNQLDSSDCTKAKTPMQISALLAYVLHGDFERKYTGIASELYKKFSDDESDCIEAARLFVTIKDDNYVDARFDDIVRGLNGDKSLGRLCKLLLQALLENAKNSKQFSFKCALALLSVCEDAVREPSIDQMSSLYNPTDAMSEVLSVDGAGLYAAILDAAILQNQEVSVYVEWLRNSLTSLEADDWESALQEPDECEHADLLHLTNAVFNQSVLPDALIAVLVEVDADTASWFENVEMCQLLFKLSVQDFQSISDYIWGCFVSDGWKTVLEKSGDLLLKRSWLESCSASQRETIASKIIKTHTIKHINWLRASIERGNHLGNFKSYVRHAAKSERKHPRKGDSKGFKSCLEDLISACE